MRDVCDSRKINTTSVYEEREVQNSLFKNVRYMATAILASALEDADVEFLEDDYETWKEIRLQNKKKCQEISESELKAEFEEKQNYKETLFDISNMWLKSSDIPKSKLEERNMYESNTYKNLCKMTGYTETTLTNVAKLHGWKIGLTYQEPTIFDL